MTVKEIVNKVSKTYHISEDELLKKSIREFLLKQKSEVESDILQILSSYKVKNLQELEKVITEGSEHSRLAGENVIVLETLQSRLAEIQHDLSTLF